MTDFRFVVGCSAPGVVNALADYGEPHPAILVSYAYYNAFKTIRDDLVYRDWALDSGAYTAFSSGKPIDHQKYIAFCKECKRKDPKLTDIFALDVVGDWKASLKNYEEIRRHGIDAIPTYHLGEPTHVLKTLVAEYPKVAISGYTLMIHEKKKMAYTDAVFNIAWPKKLHALGLGTERVIKSFPWHSVDASTWCLGPAAFGRWAGYGGITFGTNNIKKNLRSEIVHYMKFEKYNKTRWSEELASLEE